MKSKIKENRIIFVTIVLFLSMSPVAFATGYPVFDVSNWLSGIDRFYQGYDQLMNTITMVEQNYERIKQAYERAKSWNFESLDFDDGSIVKSIDIRDEIRDGTAQVNRQLNNIRQIKETFEAQNLSMNGKSYSMKDLAGFGASDKTLVNFVSDTGEVVKSSFENAAKALSEEMSVEEKAAVWNKYGLSGKNFYMVNDISKKIQAKANIVFAQAEEILTKTYEEEQNSVYTATLSKLFDQDGAALTEPEIQQTIAMMEKFSLDELRELRRALNNAAAYTAWKDRYDDQKQQAEKELQGTLAEQYDKDDGGQEIF